MKEIVSLFRGNRRASNRENWRSWKGKWM